MGLNLRIENEARLPDGGPLTYGLTGNRGADIGRDAHLDWTLPDPNRHVSGKHCEIRFQDGGYWLKDVSTNGTFLNGSLQRVQSPYRLRSGDRLLIGHYIVAVEVTDESAATPGPGPDEALPDVPFDAEDLWGGAVGVAAPLDPRDFRPAAQLVPVKPDFLEWAVDVPNSPGSGFVARPVAIDTAGFGRPPDTHEARDPGRADQDAVQNPVPAWPQAPGEPRSWDAGALPAPAPPEPPAPVPTPRRSIWVGPGPDGPWTGADDQASAPPAAAAPARPPATPCPRPREALQATPPADLLARFAKGAGVAPESLATRDAGDFAEWLGRLMLLVTDNVKQMLDARGQTKRITRSSNQTMIAALDNNPLKFSPSAADALRIMLGPPTRSYLGADQALQQGFDDLKAHQIKTFSAMQRALTLMLEDLDPKSIRQGLDADKGIAGWVGSKGARAFALYEARWHAKAGRQGGGLQDAFMHYFAECYDQASGPSGEPR